MIERLCTKDNMESTMIKPYKSVMLNNVKSVKDNFSDDSGNDSDGYSNGSPKSPKDFKFIEDVSEIKGDRVDKKQAKEIILKNTAVVSKSNSQNLKTVKNEIYKDQKIKGSNDVQKNNGDMITLQVRIKKSKSSKRNDDETRQKNNDVTKKSANVDNLAEDFSNISLSNKKSGQSKKSHKDQKIKIISENCQYKTDSKVAVSKELSKKSKDEKPREKKIILIERGPIRNNDIKIQCPPYEKQIHRKALSGGKVVVKNSTPEIDMIPSTIDFGELQQNILNKQIMLNTNVCNDLNKILDQYKNKEYNLIDNCDDDVEKLHGDFYNWDEDLNMIMEVLEGDQKPFHLKQNNRNISKECAEIIKNYLTTDASIFDNLESHEKNFNSLPIPKIVSQGNNDKFSDHKSYDSPTGRDISYDSLPLTIPFSPFNNLDKTLLVPPGMNTSFNNNSGGSPYSCSPLQGFQSPSLENVDNTAFSENALLYESTNTSVPSVSGESYSSFSSSDSPNFQNQDDIFNFIDSSLPNLGTSIHQDISYNHGSVNSECGKFAVNSSPNFSSISNYSPISDTFYENTQMYNSPDYLSGGEQYSLNSPEYQLQNTQSFLSNNLNSDEILKAKSQSKVEMCIGNTIKSLKKKFIPIASREAHPCCIDYKKSAKQVLEEMFNRLDEKMKKMICFKIHSASEENLKELFDGQLSSWNENMGSQFPRLPLLHATCERLLMRTKTMIKFFDVYVNGHTILDRALLQCAQSPIVVKYLAECMIRARPHVPLNSNSVIEKSDITGNTVMHRGAGRGEQCATSLAALLSLNEVNATPIFNVNRLNSDGYTPLHIACSRHTLIKPGNVCSCVQTVHVLLEHGHADPNIKDGRSGNTPLHVAVDTSNCAVDLVAMLLKNGAKPLIKNYRGATPLDLAKAACRSTTRPQYPKQVVDMLKKFK